LDTPENLGITLEGGEPTLFKNFFDIINNIKKPVDMLTNLQFDVDEFIEKIDPRFFNIGKKIGYKSIRASYHQQDQIELLSKAVKLQDAGFSIGIFSVNSPDKAYKNMEMAERCRKAQMYFYTKDLLGYFDNHLYGYYKYPDSVMAKTTKTVSCRIKELLIAPDGNCFRCHRDLYADENSIGNIMDENFVIKDIFRGCSNYGDCSPCDVKLKTNRFLEMGSCSAEIKIEEA
jgi:radical SAM protein with 4Fe4S-binding SPASM domain